MKNNFDKVKFNYISSIFLGVIFIILNLYKKNIKLLFTFLILCFFVYVFNPGKDHRNKIIESILFAIIISFILYNFSELKNKKINEGFSDKDNEEEKTDIKEEEEKFKVVKKKEKKEIDENDNNSDEDEEDREPYIDAGSTFLQAYKKLDPKQIEGMTKDTKELIETQKNLMDTVKQLAPVINEGKKVLDTFTNYFDK